MDIDESVFCGEDSKNYVIRLAKAKAVAGWNTALQREYGAAVPPVLGSDTAVVHGGDILGKPESRAQAQDMLSRLSGDCHQVFSAVAVKQGETIESRLSCTKVWFKKISAREIEAYWLSGEPADKAGAYGIQGFGAVFVERIEGSYSGVVGLPLCETAQLLRLFRVPYWLGEA